jgi:predicted nucleic acid-binding protein
MTPFADSSAIVKLYADEPGHETIRELDQLVVAQVTRVEVPAALWRKQRMDQLSAEDSALLVTQFEADWFGTDQAPRRFEIVRLTALILEDAARLTATHQLRAYDAVQLATARAVRAADPRITQFVAFDHTLLRAAAADGFTTNLHIRDSSNSPAQRSAATPARHGTIPE